MKLSTSRKESFKTRLFRFFMNLYPMYFGTGGKVTFISSDWMEVHLRLKRNMWTYNYVGTIFGGSMFSACDPFYMVMLYNVLGKNDFVVWDKSAHIQFLKPGKNALYMKCELTPELVQKFRDEISKNGKMVHDIVMEWTSADGVPHSRITRTLYAASKEFYHARKR